MTNTIVLAVIIAVIALVWWRNNNLNRVSDAQNGVPALSSEYQWFPLIKKEQVTHDTALYTFGLPSSESVLGLPVGQHITVRAQTADGTAVRSYTPMSLDAEMKGQFQLLIKTYEKGKVSQAFAHLKEGDSIEIAGPKGFYSYTRNARKHLGMIAGGTGITPMYQIIRTIALDPRDRTKVTLLYGNRTEADILLKHEIDELVAKRPGQITVHYILDSPDPEWKGHSGFITKEMMQELLPGPTKGSQLLLCGPLPMVSIMKKNAVSLGFPKAKPVSKMDDQVFSF